MEFISNALAGKDQNEVVDSTKVPTPSSLDDGSSTELPPPVQVDGSATELPKSLEKEPVWEDAQREEEYVISSPATSETMLVPSPSGSTGKTTRKRNRSPSTSSTSSRSNSSSRTPTSPAKTDVTKKINKLETALKKLTRKVAFIERTMPKCFTTRRRKIRKTTATRPQSISI